MVSLTALLTTLVLQTLVTTRGGSRAVERAPEDVEQTSPLPRRHLGADASHGHPALHRGGDQCEADRRVDERLRPAHAPERPRRIAW